jgi:exodeoxyribonuclease VIII
MIAVECPKVKFTNARIVGSGINPADHHAQEHKRGHREYVMSRGSLMDFNECPAKWIVGTETEQTSFMQWGDLIDCLLTSAETFDSRFAVCPETYKDAKTGEDKPWNWNANVCKQWRQENEGRSLIKHDLRLDAETALEKLTRCHEISDALWPAKFQVSLSAEYFDQQTELTIPIRGLVDIAPDGGDCANSLIDLKTTASAEPRKWARKVSEDHLDAQAALYLDLWKAATGEERTDFRHIVQESLPPYHVELRLLSMEFIELGRIKYRSALMKYCQCLTTGIWPGYPHTEMTFGRWSLCSPEAWMLATE